MHRNIMDHIIDELRVKQCLRDIAQHWSFRSTVPGPGLRNVSEFLCRRHREHGIEAEVIPYPADDKTEWLDGHKNPLEWIPRAGRLEIVKPEDEAGVICSYAEEPLSLVCNSTSTPAGGVDAPVVVIHSGMNDEAYKSVELLRKICFTELPAGSVEAQARKRGAIGVISDCVSPPWLRSHPPMREPEDAPDLTMWSVFSGHRNDETPLWGFSLSARQGRRLRKIIRESCEPIVLHVEVDAELVPGTSEVVNAFLPGTDLAQEEIWVLAHSSEPGARDNASGCCLSVELARTLKALIEGGTLPPLRRSIRFMNAVEVSGFLPYIDSRRDELDRVIAGLCLDSVGQDFGICGGEFVLFQSPETNASFIDGLMEHLFAAAAAEPIGRFSWDSYATFPWHTEPFWGNDAFISDGFFDIPTPQMSTWPDRFYHSSMDTPDQMSENTLGRAGAIAGTYLYLLATAGAREALWFAGLAARDWKRRICHALSMEVVDEVTTSAAKSQIPPNPPLQKGGTEGALGKGGNKGSPLDERAAHLRAVGRHLGFQGQDALKQVLRFAPDDINLGKIVHGMCGDMEDFAARETDKAIELAAALAGQETPSAREVPSYEEVDQRGTEENHGDTEARREERQGEERRGEEGWGEERWREEGRGEERRGEERWRDRGKGGRGELPCIRDSAASSMVVKRLRWRAPADNAFSEAGRAKLSALRERANVGRIWNWINGRRTIEEIWERMQFGGAVPYDVVAEYVELLVAEDFAARVGV